MSQQLSPSSKSRRRANDADPAVQRAPGRAPRTSKKGGASAPPVQRRAQDGARPAVRSADEWTKDPAMQAAHGIVPVQRKTADDDVVVQREEEQTAQSEDKEKSGGFFASIGNAVRGLSERLRRLGGELATSRFDDLDASMYRVSMQGSEQVVEAVSRMVDEDGTVFYVATGLVTGFSGERPIVEAYDPVVDLGDWSPRVTHVNGMMVTPEGGIGSATALHDSIASSLDESMMPPDVLYTYSAKGGFFPDLIECIEGKLGIEDEVIVSQEQLMLDAVHSGQRITMSAHSRGTIKTDVAVRNVHAVLREEMTAELMSSPEAEQAATEAAEMARRMAAAGHPTLSPDLAAEIARRGAAKRLSGKRAWDTIEAHVQLIYAGNAVKFPSPPAELVVGRSDFVSMSVGTYFKLGRDIKRFEKVSGGHGFDENYAATVGEWIADDLTGTPSS
ncbi:hypothetical protein [Haliangium sp.]|uniref:hypothetical protein n=1 Tax=Haliangium sp. TaxID=2663208 RepID=UPI003D0BAAEA